MPTGLQESITATGLPHAKSDLCVLAAAGFHCLHLVVMAILKKGSLITRTPKTKLRQILASYGLASYFSPHILSHMVSSATNVCGELITFVFV